jgi:hypothetical protein
MPRQTFAGEAFSRLLQNCVSSAGLTFDRVFSAVCDGVHVSGRAADGVAGGSKHRSADQGSGEDFLDHIQSPGLGG